MHIITILKAVLLSLFLAGCVTLDAQIYATSETHGENGFCAGCSVSDGSHAVDNNYHGTHSVLYLTSTNSNAFVYQRLKFPHVASTGSSVSAIVESHTGTPLNAALLASVRLTTYHNGISNNDTKSSAQVHISSSSATEYILEFSTPHSFDELEIELTGGHPAAISELRIYGAYYSASSLPVELLYFNGVHRQGTNLISWATASEVNSDHFSVERSEDGEHFAPLAKIQSAGNSNSKLEYSYLDEQLGNEIHYYRLRQTDFDGRYEIFDIISVQGKHSRQARMTVHGNPFKHAIALSYNSLLAGTVSLLLTDLQGRVLHSASFESTEGLNHFTLTDIEHLPHGQYMLHLMHGDHNDTRHLIKM